jgi:hypothetical protein
VVIEVLIDKIFVWYEELGRRKQKNFEGTTTQFENLL